MLFKKRLKTFPILLLLSGVMLLGIVFIGYIIPNRTYVYHYWVAMGFAFMAYFIIIKYFDDAKFYKINYSTSIILRVVLLSSVPLLSDDLYRFFWDGAQMLNGVNPFSFTPKELLAFNYDWVDPQLFAKMNSPEYYSVYPPINQFAFLMSALAGKGNLLGSAMILRCIIIIFDLGNIFLLKKLLHHFNKKESLVFLYALNPLVIVELTGNLHFEAVMIFFTLLSFWYLLKNKWVLASIALGFAICAKLLPLIFLPLFIRHIGLKKTFYAGIIVGFTVIILFFPFIHNLPLLQHLFSSLHLYYGNFEFNGSIQQLLKASGWALLGHDPIVYTSRILISATLIGFFIAFRKSTNIIAGGFWFMLVYYLFSAVVHPWYIIILICFTPFVQWRFALLWSALICLTYFAYSTLPYRQSTLLTTIEYAFVVLAFAIEWLRKNAKEKFLNL